MIKKVIILGVLALVSVMPAVQAQTATSTKIAVVDLNEVFTKYEKTKKAETELQQQVGDYRKERTDRMNESRKLIESAKELEKAVQDNSLSADARKKKEDELQDKVKAIREQDSKLREFDQTSQRLIQDRSQRLRNSVLAEINKVVESSSKGKYNLVLDKTALTAGATSFILYTEGVKDITTEVVTILNNNLATGAGSAPSTPAPAATTPAAKN